MVKTSTKAKSTKKATAKIDNNQSSVALNSYLQNEIARLAEMHNVNTDVFTNFAYFVIENYKKKDSPVKPVKVKPLSLPQIKAAIYQHFSVINTTELKKSGAFQRLGKTLS
jgi:hypothetical protein